MRKNIPFILIILMLLTASLPSHAGGKNGDIETLVVTGSPASAGHIRRMVQDYYARRGFKASLNENKAIKSLMPGGEIKVQVELEKASPGAANEKKEGEGNSEKTTGTLRVVNEYVPSIPCEFLAFSNHPEKVSERGILFQAGLIRHKPVRLRYYHQGEEKSPAHYLGFFLVNPTRKPARVHVVESLGGPSKNFMLAGHMNNLKFFSRKEYNQGWIQEIPPQSTTLVRRVLMKPGEVASATADLHLISGGPLQMYMYASEQEDNDLAAALAQSKKDRHARGAYPLTRIVTDATFSTQRREAFYTVADTPLSNIFKGKPIRGNYGVMYQYHFTLENPYPEERTVSFFFQPRGGIATGTFSFNGHTVSVGFTRAYHMVRLYRVTIPPKGKKEVEVETMPEDASNYPVRIILQSK